MSRKSLALCFVVLFSGLFAAISALAQVVTGTLVGVVKDSSGAIIPKATIVAIQTSTNVQRTSATTSDGYFNFPYLSPGNYQVKISAPGFATLTQENITISVETVVRVDAVLTLARTTGEVVVSAAPPSLQTESAEVNMNLESREVNDIPLEFRQAEGLVELSAGVSISSGGSPSLGDPAGTILYNANGQSVSANGTVIDGVDTRDPQDGGTTYVPAPELIQEVHVATSNYSAEFGRVAGGLINISTRQGTNSLHGTLWEYNRNSAFGAKNYFSANLPVPPLVYNDFGAVIDGPIIRNKIFFTGSYRGQRSSQSVVTTTTVPNPEFFTGDFSAVPGALIYNPFTGNPDGTGRTAFSGAKIPDSLITAQAKAINKYFPKPTDSTAVENNYTWNAPNTYTANTYFGRVDYNFNESTKLFAETGIQKTTFLSNTALPLPLGAGQEAHDTVVAPMVNFTHSFGPRLLTELRLAYDYYGIHWHDANNTVSSADIGITDPTPNPFSDTGLAQFVAGITFGGQINSPADVITHLSQVIDTWTKELPNQTLKWGAEFHRYSVILAEAYNTGFGGRGSFYFEPATTQLKVTSSVAPSYGPDSAYINAFAAYLLGTPQETTRAYLTQSQRARQNQIEAFFQDTWHVTPRLTLDAGIREEYYGPGYTKNKGGASRYDWNTNNLYIAGYGANNLATNVSSQSLVEPRVGISYRLDRDSVIRGGYAMSGWSGQNGFTGSQLTGNFPTLTIVQQGLISGYGYTGDVSSIPAAPTVQIPSNGVSNPAPNLVFLTMDKNTKMPYVESWNLFYEKAIKSGFTFDVGYVGNEGKHGPANMSLNVAAPGTGSAGLRLTTLFGRTAATTLRAQVNSTNYHALQMNLSRRFIDGLFLRVGYTYSKSMDLQSNQAGFMDNVDLSRNYGPSSFDTTHNFVLGHVYELPFGKGKPFLNKNGLMSLLVSGWQTNGVLRIRSGMPFTPVAVATSCNCPGNSQFAQQVAPIHYLHGIGTGHPWFDPSSYTPPPANQFGNAGRDSIRGPGFKQYDFSLFREFSIGERLKLQGRGEFYNATNTPSFNNPAATVDTAATFGIITSANANQRVGQLALKLLF
jgi:outer membrane receptor protein involved in Fe transport